MIVLHVRSVQARSQDLEGSGQIMGPITKKDPGVSPPRPRKILKNIHAI